MRMRVQTLLYFYAVKFLIRLVNIPKALVVHVLQEKKKKKKKKGNIVDV